MVDIISNMTCVGLWHQSISLTKVDFIMLELYKHISVKFSSKLKEITKLLFW